MDTPQPQTVQPVDRVDLRAPSWWPKRLDFDLALAANTARWHAAKLIADYRRDEQKEEGAK